VNAVLIPSGSPAALYAGLNFAGVYQRDLASGIWTSFNTGLPKNSSVFSLLQDPTAPDTIYAVTNKEVFKKKAGGNWMTAGIGCQTIVLLPWPLTPHPDNPLCRGIQGVYALSGGSGTWTTDNNGLPAAPT